MIDGVQIVAHVEAPGRVAERLERARTSAPADPMELPTVTGYVGSLRARLRADRLVLRGSLPRYMGETSPLPFWRVAEARQRIEDALGIDLRDSHLWRLEITADLTLSLPPSAYFPLLLRHPTMKRFEYEGETVGYLLDARTLVFYDRAAKCKAKKEPLPSGTPLRVELQYGKQLRRQLKWGRPFTLADLETPATWPYLASRWREEYERVEKARAPLGFDPLADIRRSVALAGLGALGREVAEVAVRAQMDAGTLARNTGHRRLAWIRQLASDPELTVQDERVAELDAAVREAAERALGW